ncbi:MAG: DegV family protein [Wenzhouxiangella sp.]|jgi:DegV family protein with EDD domain|nr:DegV family protein [Wenzhouxiangella sp.]
MTKPSGVITHVDGQRLGKALLAGIANVLSRRGYINSINVFPVPDSDTGTNLAFTLQSVREAIESSGRVKLPDLLQRVADAAIDGARGNSGAIMAQYFQGFSESSRDYQVLDGKRLARVSNAAARSAWGAMSEPVPGTLPTVLEDFADELTTRAEQGIEDIRELFRKGLQRAQRSLAHTPDQLKVLKDNGVVDAGGQGFVDLLEGIWSYIKTGRVPKVASTGDAAPERPVAAGHSEGVTEHRFCTECLLEGQALDIVGLRGRLESLDASSLVVAGGGRRARVHIHTDAPGEVFRICSDFGEICQQKADDMTRQHGLMNQTGSVAIVTDSAADLPAEEIDRLGIHVVPIRLNFDEEEFLDKVTITPSEFYRRLAASSSKPLTSQPPPADFRRQFELLTSHGLDVLAIQISGNLSGTLQAAQAAAKRVDAERIEVFDSLNAACGQALMVLWAAEAAARGWERVAIVSYLKENRHLFNTYSLVRDLSWGVRGGRVKPWMETVSRRLRLNLVLANNAEGRLGAKGIIPGRRNAVARFARHLIRRMDPASVYRVLISHSNAIEDAQALRDALLNGHPRIDACWLEDASPAVGVHAGPGALVVGLQPWQAPEDRRA